VRRTDGELNTRPTLRRPQSFVSKCESGERKVHVVLSYFPPQKVSKYMLRPRRPPSQAWRAFLNNHAKDLIALDFFTVPTATFRVLFVLVVLSHDRRRLVHFNVTEHPTAGWTARQLVEACGLEETPRYLIRDRDQVYGERFSRQARTLRSEEHTSELQSHSDLVCRLLLEKKKKK